MAWKDGECGPHRPELPGAERELCEGGSSGLSPSSPCPLSGGQDAGSSLGSPSRGLSLTLTWESHRPSPCPLTPHPLPRLFCPDTLAAQ